MDNQHKKLKRTITAEMEEAKKLTDSIVKKLYKDYKKTPHSLSSKKDMFENIEDLSAVHDAIHRMIVRRNASYIHDAE